jgi:hypothetical protein
LTLVSEGNPLRRLLLISKAVRFFELLDGCLDVLHGSSLFVVEGDDCMDCQNEMPMIYLSRSKPKFHGNRKTK